jgi:hypothetical protein
MPSARVQEVFAAVVGRKDEKSALLKIVLKIRGARRSVREQKKEPQYQPVTDLDLLFL